MPSPIRVVSLVPSLTELIFWFGRGECLVGRTRFCEEPKDLVDGVAIVGGTKNPNVERIVALKPDLVLANKEENRKEDISALRARGIEVHLTDPNTVLEAVAMIEDLGAVFGERDRATRLADEIRAELVETERKPVRVFAAVWRQPLLGLGGETYGSSLLHAVGGENVLAHRPRYPEIKMAELAELAPDLILLPDEPFPFTSEHIPEFASVAPSVVIDGKLLWWYGPRMPAAMRTLRQILVEGRQRR